MSSISFYFDFVSPYAYLASNFIDALAEKHKQKIQWLPFRLGVTVVKVMGIKPAMDTPLKNSYIQQDVMRMAKVLGIPITSNMSMFDPVPAQRLCYATAIDQRGHLAKELLRARWAENLDLSDRDVLISIAKRVGISQDKVRLALKEPETRIMVRNATDAAISLGVFGSPTFAVGSELFWGVDRMWLLDSYLAANHRYQFEGEAPILNDVTTRVLKLYV